MKSISLMIWSQTVPLVSSLVTLHFALWVPVISNDFFLFFKLIFTEPALYHESDAVLRIFTWLISFSSNDNSRRLTQRS